MSPEDLRALLGQVPFADHLGIAIRSVDPDELVLDVDPRSEHTTSIGTVHGGFLMSLADCAGALGSYLNLPDGSQGTTTTESKTNMLRPAQQGVPLTATATPVSRGRRLQVWQTRVEQEGRLISLTTQTQMNL